MNRLYIYGWSCCVAQTKLLKNGNYANIQIKYFISVLINNLLTYKLGINLGVLYAVQDGFKLSVN